MFKMTTTVKAQGRIRVRTRIRTRIRVRATSVVLICAILMVVIRMIVTVAAFTYNPSVMSPLLPPEKVHECCCRCLLCIRSWCHGVRLRGSGLQCSEKRRRMVNQRVMYPVLHITPSGLIDEEPESSITPDFFCNEDGEDEEEELTAEVMNVYPEELVSVASTMEKDNNSCQTTPEEQYWSVFGHEKGFLDGPLNPMHKRRELLEHLEKHPSMVKKVMKKLVDSTTSSTIPEGREKGGGGVGVGTTSNIINRIGDSMQNLVTGEMDGSIKGDSPAANGLQPLIRGETSIEDHLQALFDANIAEHHQGEKRLLPQQQY